MNESTIADWLCEQVLQKMDSTYTMGDIENTLSSMSKEVCRMALTRAVQHLASEQPFECEQCGCGLNVKHKHRKRTVESSYGPIMFSRAYGLCPDCLKYSYPADSALGLQERASASPRVQEICALTTLRAPAGQAEADVRRLTGLNICGSTLHREARRQGERAVRLRDADELLTQTPKGVAELASRAEVHENPFTLIIEMDAWNIRERDNWGQTKKLKSCGKDTNRWHWVYTGTVFRLDQRSRSISGRPIISERGYVATRRGIEGFQRQTYAEALQRGLLKAENVLILADGAIWIWNIADDRFKGAQQRVDLYHVKEHLWELAGELFGRGTEDAEKWVRPFLNWLKKRNNGALDVINSLQEIDPKKYTEKQQKILSREINYFTCHKDRMDYKKGKSAGQPVGSGAIESTCAQYQRRFKLTGQFWSLEGDEALLALDTLHRNNRWHKLFPHDLQ